MRLRAAQGKLKIEHSIIDGLRRVLELLLARNVEIRSVIPGVIRPVRDAKGEPTIRVTVPTTNGWKAIALSAGARQELFISTALTKEELEHAISRGAKRRVTIGACLQRNFYAPVRAFGSCDPDRQAVLRLTVVVADRAHAGPERAQWNKTSPANDDGDK